MARRFRPRLAYGKQGAPPQIPADATLAFGVRLLGIMYAAPRAGQPKGKRCGCRSGP